MDVGFIGLGAMGQAMAANLLNAGHRLRVWNRTSAVTEALARLGAEPVASAQAAFTGDVVISMLANDEAVRSVIVDAGLITQAPTTTVHVNMATVSITLAEELTALHREAGIAYVAAPVFGRPEAATAAKLNIVAAGPEDAIDRVQPLFDALAQKTWRVGTDPQRANVVKVAGNFMIAAAIESMAESITLSEAHGVSATDLLNILTNTLFASPIYQNYGALIAAQKYEPPGFRLALGLKDVRLALAAGDHAQLPLPLASLLRDQHLDAIAHGDGDKDWTALAEVARRRAGR